MKNFDRFNIGDELAKMDAEKYAKQKAAVQEPKDPKAPPEAEGGDNDRDWSAASEEDFRDEMHKLGVFSPGI